MFKIRDGIQKSVTGIRGLDEISRGGLPRGRTTLIRGDAGSGKSLFALQSLVHGARNLREPGIFVTFEENAQRLCDNASSFGWNLPALTRGKLLFIDAQPSPDVINSGGADLQGLLAALDARSARMGAKRIVLDSLDALLPWVGDAEAVRRELARINHWLLNRDFTVLITARASSGSDSAAGNLDFLPFMTDCVISLRHREVDGVSQRSVRIQKYRGSSFVENASPFIIGVHGIEVAGLTRAASTAPASTARISTGVADLDAMLDGGYLRGSSVLVTGAPGTAKTTLGGALLESCCARGERALLVSFDSSRAEIVRNLASVHLRLGRFVRRGLLRIESRRAAEASAEAHLLDIRTLIDEQRPEVLMIDPVSALGERGNEITAHDVVSRLIQLAKERGITVFCTSLLGDSATTSEASRLQISTVADAWIHLTYVVNAGERNRALSVVKSRGTAHSNQVRELVLDSKGVSLAEVYTAEGSVLMGSLRLQREQSDRSEALQRQAERQRERLRAEASVDELEARIRALQRELAFRRADAALMAEVEGDADAVRTRNLEARIVRRERGRES